MSTKAPLLDEADTPPSLDDTYLPAAIDTTGHASAYPTADRSDAVSSDSGGSDHLADNAARLFRHTMDPAMEDTPAVGPPSWLRIGALVDFCVLSLTLGLQWISFADVLPEAEDYFGLTKVEINTYPVIFMSTYVAIGPLSTNVFDRYGLKRGLLVSSVLNTVAGVLKLVAALVLPAPWLLMVAAVAGAVSQAFMLGAPPLLSLVWFPEHERTLATTVAAVSNTCGSAFGLLLPPLLVKGLGGGRKGFGVFFTLQLVLCVGQLLSTTLVIPAAPPLPPSAAAAARLDPSKRKHHARTGLAAVRHEVAGTVAECGSLLRHMAQCFTDGPSLCALVASSLCIGIMWVLSATMAQLLSPFGFSETTVAAMGFANIIAGVIGSTAIGALVDKIRRYRVPLFVLVTVACASLCAILLVLTVHPSTAAVFALYCVMGVAQNSVIPVGFEFLAELTFPHDAATSGVLLIVVSSTVSLTFMLTTGLVLGESPTTGDATLLMLVFLALLLVSVVAAALSTDKFRRAEYEASRIAADDGALPLEMAECSGDKCRGDVSAPTDPSSSVHLDFQGIQV